MEPMRFLVTQVESSNRVAGNLVSGNLKKDDSVVTAPSGHQTSILGMEQAGAACVEAEATTELTLDLTYSVNMKPGDIIAAADSRPEFSDQFEAQIEWHGDQELLPGRTYSLNAIGGESEATVSRLKYRFDEQSGQQIAASTLAISVFPTPASPSKKSGRLRLVER